MVKILSLTNKGCNIVLKKGRANITAFIALIISLLALYASFMGVLEETIYQEVLITGTVTENTMAGSIAQDMVSILLAVILVLVALLFLKKGNYKALIGIIGLIGYFLYAYGLYVIQGQYTSLYLLYMAIFALSIYGFIWGLTSFNIQEAVFCQVRKKTRISTAIFLLLIIIVLTPAWVSQLLSDIANRVHCDVYAVPILDLCIEFPAFIIISIGLLRKKNFAGILGGVALLKVFTVCLSWAFGEFGTAYILEKPVNIAMAYISSLLTLISIILTTIYLKQLEKVNY